MPFTKSLKGSQQEAFTKDSELVQKAKEDYFKTNFPHFNHEILHDLSGVFQDRIAYANLLGSQIYEIHEVRMGLEDLQYANNALKTLPKGLWFFQPVPHMESPKVMGLTGVQNAECPLVLCWGDLLPLVQEGGAEWRDNSWSPADNTL